jgi:hypothetical protein
MRGRFFFVRLVKAGGAISCFIAPRAVNQCMAVTMRLISLILIVTALMLLGADAVTSLEKGGELTVRSLDTAWQLVNPGSLYWLKTWLHDHAAFAAQPVYSFLASPGWGVTGVIGVILAFIFGRRLGPE